MILRPVQGSPRVAAAFILGLFLLTGCASDIVERAVHNDRANFNEAIVQSWNEQLLLNLVRLRYRDNPLFLEMSSVIAGYSLKGSAGLAGGTVFQSPLTGDWRVSLGGEYTTSPTLTYFPLQGEDFATRLLTPISPSMILFLSQSGWSISRLFTLCVQQANEIPNAVSASGPTPDLMPAFEKAKQISEALRVLQRKGIIEGAMDKDGKTVLLYINPGKDSSATAEVTLVRRLLDLDSTTSVYHLIPAFVRERKDEIAMMGRSILSVMFFLSQAVEVPQQDVQAGKVTLTRNEDGSPFDWSHVTGKVFSVKSSQSEPQDAYVRVFYRNHWFYISDTDLSTKTTFSLLTYLFNLKAAGKGSQEPFLTYPVR
jgi:hypothetical protein